ncbi:hypothetical protein HMPREF2132_05735 [Prevotella histicola JCM 15637 = DNF00424]|uniref:Uncharacterized protein n=1 Tax=Prevotella histicola JCM 15637 = DNF00424 TaxID=1236504 RepID=A0AAW3FGE6_9BACT|nr:hypothetical protein HMPREF2132_05735 [Prevotella histicola JCM 15637 = DNF00424]
MGHPHYKELIFKSLQYLFIIKKPEKHKTITPNSGRPIFFFHDTKERKNILIKKISPPFFY